MSSSSSKTYNFNFWKPTSPRERTTNRVISIMIIIWASAVFGFQGLLIAFNKPTPEDSYIKFEQIWPKIATQHRVDRTTKIQFARILLTTLGKHIHMQNKHEQQLEETLSWLVYSLTPRKQRNLFGALLPHKREIAIQKAIKILKLTTTDQDKLLANILRNSLVPVKSDRQYRANMQDVPKIIKKYLVHNQSILTDFKFLGFPFHYWYSAQFLLILFVTLCVLYARFIDHLNKKYKANEDN